MKPRYYVGGFAKDRASAGPWIGYNARPERGWQNFVVCKTFAHALAQYRRAPVRYRQIDLRGRGVAKALVWGRATRPSK